MEISPLPPFPIFIVHGAQPAQNFTEAFVGSHCWSAVSEVPMNNFCLRFRGVRAGGIFWRRVNLAQGRGPSPTWVAEISCSDCSEIWVTFLGQLVRFVKVYYINGKVEILQAVQSTVYRGKLWAEIWMVQKLIYCLRWRKEGTEWTELQACLVAWILCYPNSPWDAGYSIPSRVNLQECG